MKRESRRISPCKVRVEIRLESYEVDAEFEKRFVEMKRRGVFPGFRRGRIPFDVVRAKAGHAVENELWARLTASSMERACREMHLTPLSKPRFFLPLYAMPREGEPWAFGAEFYDKPVPSCFFDTPAADIPVVELAYRYDPDAG